MNEETNTAVAATETETNVDPNAPMVEINGIKKTLKSQTFGKLSKLKNQEFYAPEFDLTNDWADDSKWIGLPYIQGILNRTARKAFGEIYAGAINPDTGKLDQAKWLMDAQDWTSGVAKLSDLEDEIASLQDQQSALTEDENLGTTNPDGTKTLACIAVLEKIRGISEKIRPLRQEVIKIRARYADRVKAKEAEAASASSK